MTSHCCNVEDILHLNDTKEYVLLSQNILELLISDSRINAQAAKLWHFLYSKVKFDKNLSITLPYQWLAEQLKKSVRTISRYIETLVNYGYLQLSPNYGDDGSRLANTLFVRLPQTALPHLQSSNDRKKVNNTPQDTPPDKTVRKAPDTNGRANNNIINNTNNNTPVVVVNNDSINTNEPDTMFHVEHETALSDKKPNEQITEKERVESPTVNQCSDSQSHPEIHQLQEQASKLGLQLKKAQASLTQTPSANHLQRVTQIESHYHAVNTRLNQLQRQIQHNQQQHRFKQQWQQNSDWVLDKEGERAFSSFEKQRLKKGLQALTEPQQVPKLLNEIAYAIRFGDLRQQNKTKNPLSIHHGINIALKLVREGRWDTPSGLEETLLST